MATNLFSDRHARTTRATTTSELWPRPPWLPVGVQVIAAPGREDRVLAVMQALEASSAVPLIAP